MLEPAIFDFHSLAVQFHRNMPERIRMYLVGRGIPEDIIERHLLGWNGSRITIPIPDREGRMLMFRLARDPESGDESPKMVSTPGASAELYGWEVVREKPARLLIAEGEFDRLVLEAQGFPAVTSTGGAQSFSESWVPHLLPIPDLYIVYDRDQAGVLGAMKVARLLPHARLVTLPPEVGEHGDVTDFFVRLGRSKDEFEALLAAARPVPRRLPRLAPRPRNEDLFARVAEAKRRTPIARVIGTRITLTHSGRNFVGRCPFHNDRHPSLVVFAATESFWCFGCGKGGDSLTFIQEADGISFMRALEALERMGGI